MLCLSVCLSVLTLSLLCLSLLGHSAMSLCYVSLLANANFHFAQEATLNNILEFSLSETYAPKQIRDEFFTVRPLCVWGRVKR